MPIPSSSFSPNTLEVKIQSARCSIYLLSSTKNRPSGLSQEALIRYELGRRPRELSSLSCAVPMAFADESNRTTNGGSAIWNGAEKRFGILFNFANEIRRMRLNQWRGNIRDKTWRGAVPTWV